MGTAGCGATGAGCGAGCDITCGGGVGATGVGATGCMLAGIRKPCPENGSPGALTVGVNGLAELKSCGDPLMVISC